MTTTVYIANFQSTGTLPATFQGTIEHEKGYPGFHATISWINPRTKFATPGVWDSYTPTSDHVAMMLLRRRMKAAAKRNGQTFVDERYTECAPKKGGV